jgi:hypothetical protein
MQRDSAINDEEWWSLNRPFHDVARCIEGRCDNRVMGHRTEVVGDE